jgi:protein-S-isoprenylcysteine O-methyltransferase Ste14
VLENRYAVVVVRVQRERGQHVITTGPYRFVRHPMYAGAILLFVGTPLLLGSWYGLIGAAVIIGLFCVRITIEERTLRAELEGYGEYTARVPYRERIPRRPRRQAGIRRREIHRLCTP